MTKIEAESKYPTFFVIANQQVRVEFVDRLSRGRFGEWNSLTNTIKVALSALDEDDSCVEFPEEVIHNTLWHEIFHVFNFFWNTDLDESLAQSFANFMCEYESTKNN